MGTLKIEHAGTAGCANSEVLLQLLCLVLRRQLFRSRSEGSVPIPLNLSIAQVLRLIIQFDHISLI